MFNSVRSVVLLTDGQVSNEPAILALARRHQRGNHIFSFGIGSACSAFLVKGIARATGGSAEFIAYNERIEEKVPHLKASPLPSPTMCGLIEQAMCKPSPSFHQSSTAKC